MHARIDLILRVETSGKIEYGRRMTVIRCILFFVLLVGLNACTTNPVTGKSEMGFVSESEEIRHRCDRLLHPLYHHHRHRPRSHRKNLLAQMNHGTRLQELVEL